MVKYVEGCAPTDHVHRLRLIYATSSAEQNIHLWLQRRTTDYAICQLERQSTLSGIELSFTDPLLDSDLDAIKQHSDIDVHVIDKSLPKLEQQGLLLMDMDSTAIEMECIDELAKIAGVGDQVAEVTEQAMQGKLDFEQALRERVATLKGLPADVITELCQKLPLMSGLTEMIAELQSYGWKVALASGGFIPFVESLKLQLNLDAAFANDLVIESGKLTGKLQGDIVDAKYKANVLLKLAKQFDIEHSQCVAIGDGANDIPMLQQADLGIAYHAKEKVSQLADMSIKHLDLRVLPFLFSK
ncbi:MAG: phosphoserine phosphatase SerB [Parashewanella sp.]